jgi:hypothetical protein
MLHCTVYSMHSRTTSCNRADRTVGCIDRAWQTIPARRDQAGQWALPLFLFLFLFFSLRHPIEHSSRSTYQRRVPPLALPGQTALVALTSTGSTLPFPRYRVVIPPPGDKPTPQVLACWPSWLMSALAPSAAVTAVMTAAPAVTGTPAAPVALTVILATAAAGPAMSASAAPTTAITSAVLTAAVTTTAAA